MTKRIGLPSIARLALRRWAVVLAFLSIVALLSIAGCGQSGLASQLCGPSASSETAEGGQSVQLQILQGQGGATLALVPVTINGQGPYPFALDTGATTSLVDTSLATQLNLRVVGRAQQVTGVTGTESANLVELAQWQAGSVNLPAVTATSVSLPGAGGGTPLVGLLGSDVLSTYNTVIVDYQHGTLVLAPKEGTP